MDKGKFGYKSGDMMVKPTNEEDIWNSKWDIYLKIGGDDTRIGWVSFEGPKEKGTIPISMELLPLYRHRGHGPNVLKMMREWAFLHGNIYEISAECPNDNTDSIHALQKAGFVYREGSSVKAGAMERYSVTKQRSSWLGLYILIGVVGGIILGIALGHIWVGFGVAMFAGIVIGISMDAAENKKRRDVTGRKK